MSAPQTLAESTDHPKRRGGKQKDQARGRSHPEVAAAAAVQDDVEDAADILDVALPSLFDIPPIAFSSRPNSLHTYTPPPQTGSGSGSRGDAEILLRIPDPSADNYTRLQANQLWLSAVYLADLVHLGQVPVSGLRVAELGAAAGLPGVSACRKGALVVGTDWGDEDILSSLKDNFSRACGGDEEPGDRGQGGDEGGGSRGGGAAGKKWAVRAHEWGTDTLPLTTALGPERQGTLFDKLLLADTLWVTEAHSALLDSVYALLKPGGIAHVAAGLHTGRGPLDRFIKAAEERGGRVEKRREVMWKKEGGWDDVVVHSTGLEEERGVVVYFELRVPE